MVVGTTSSQTCPVHSSRVSSLPINPGIELIRPSSRPLFCRLTFVQQLMFAAVFAFALLGCRATEQSVVRRAPCAPGPKATALSANGHDATMDPPLPSRAWELLAQLEPTKAATSKVGIAQVCASDNKPVVSESTAAFDQRRSKWVVVDVERDMGEHARIAWRGFVPVSQGRAGPPEQASDNEETASFCRAVANDPDIVETPNLVEGRALENFVTGAASVLVQFESWVLYADPGDQSGHDVVHLFRTNGRDHAVIARKGALSGVIDEGSCRAHPGSLPACFEVRAYISIEAVRHAPDGGSLLIQGYRGPEDHAHAGAFHWVVPLATKL